jgi:hypothetical protein
MIVREYYELKKFIELTQEKLKQPAVNLKEVVETIKKDVGQKFEPETEPEEKVDDEEENNEYFEEQIKIIDAIKKQMSENKDSDIQEK